MIRDPSHNAPNVTNIQRLTRSLLPNRVRISHSFSRQRSKGHTEGSYFKYLQHSFACCTWPAFSNQAKSISGHSSRYSQYILDLTSFWNSQTGFWASGTLQTSRLNYTCPEFNGLDMGNTGAVATAIARYINSQYGCGRVLSSEGLPGVSLLAQPPATEAAQAVALRSIPPSRGAPPTHGVPPGHGAPNVIYDWAARIHAKKFELGKGFATLIFLGDVKGDEEHWRTCPSFVGAHRAFVNSATGQCANCREQEELVVVGFVHQ